MLPNSDTRGRFVLSSNSCSILFLAYLWMPARLNKFSHTLKYSAFKGAILNKTEVTLKLL